MQIFRSNMREVRGSIPRESIIFFFFLFLPLQLHYLTTSNYTKKVMNFINKCILFLSYTSRQRDYGLNQSFFTNVVISSYICLTYYCNRLTVITPLCILVVPQDPQAVGKKPANGQQYLPDSVCYPLVTCCLHPNINILYQ